MADLKPGDRVRMNDKCPWPERVGAVGVVVAPRGFVYPGTPPAHEVLVLLDADPLRAHAPHHPDRWWTCQTDRRSLDPEVVGG